MLTSVAYPRCGQGFHPDPVGRGGYEGHDPQGRISCLEAEGAVRVLPALFGKVCGR